MATEGPIYSSSLQGCVVHVDVVHVDIDVAVVHVDIDVDVVDVAVDPVDVDVEDVDVKHPFLSMAIMPAPL